jgi:hypothetical protein
MNPELLVELQITLRLAIEAISRHDKTIESSVTALGEMLKAQAIVESRLQAVESVDVVELNFEVKAMKANTLLTQRRMDGFSLGLAIAIMTAIFSVISSLIVLQLSKPVATPVTQSK